jgi:hypothetical protein
MMPAALLFLTVLVTAVAQDLPPATGGTPAEYRGRRAIRVASPPDRNTLVPLEGVRFGSGVIEVDLAGAPGAGAAQTARGFVGIAFRTQSAEKYECVYLRPSNGRADDQVRRNHSIQYVAEPDFPWPRLRKEFPEKYESYADLETGAWTRYRLVVDGSKARLYLHGAEQPSLIVNGLLLGSSEGGVALWAGPGTEAYFANFRITQR